MIQFKVTLGRDTVLNHRRIARFALNCSPVVTAVGTQDCLKAHRQAMLRFLSIDSLGLLDGVSVSASLMSREVEE
jgi:hypothetical protein